MRPSEQRKRFIQSIRAQVRRRHRQIDESVIRVLGPLAEVQMDIRNLLERSATGFDAHRLPELEREISRLVDQWTRRAIGESTEAIEAAWMIGPDMVAAPLSAIDVQLSRTLVPSSLLEELKSITGKGLADVGVMAKKRIDDEIKRGVLGGRSIHDVMVDVGNELEGPGPFRMVKYRAEVAVRTNMGRAHSQAADFRLQHAARMIPGLGKEWYWSGKSRATHAAAHGQIRPVDQPFDVGGEELMFPRDPNGSPENTVLCGCESVPYHADWK